MVLLAVAAIVADQTAKWVVRETIRRGEDGVSFSGLALGHNRNDGIAFGLFAGSGRAVGIATALALPLLAVALGLLARSRPLTAIAGGLLLGGSASNLSDRLLRGEVTDYIEVGRWPAFNLADVAIVCGVGLLAWILARGEAARSEPEVP